MEYLYEDVLNIIYSKLSNGELFLLKFVSKFFNESIDVQISKKEFLITIIKTQNTEYIEYWKNIFIKPSNDSKNIFVQLLYRYCYNIDYLLTQIEKPSTEQCAKHNNLKFLKYLHENNYNWGRYTRSTAIYYGNLECLTYIIENGCPQDNHYGSSIINHTYKNVLLDYSSDIL